WQYLAKELSFEEMREKSIVTTRQLAKRQFTWLRQWDAQDYYPSNNPHLLQSLLDKIKNFKLI
ncbi:MAG TPA: tRNA (adenosine(37)-N6)-dimethylallyltransferase MiaA, partial [Coxiellaceae bacterium]|nr:tRNA (adenosine(37)-N6)-dimethylallyltransferase MiaA [Coxiellaceae bacterium]